MSQQDMDQPGCLAGCDRTPRDEAAQPTPGQLLHSLHLMGREDQLDAAQRILVASDEAMRCFTRNHEGRLARDDDERALLLWLHAEAVWLARYEDEDDGEVRTLPELIALLRTRHELARRLYIEAEKDHKQAESSRRDWAAEADRLTEVVRALSGELGEAGFEHAAVTAALATVQPDLEFDYDEPPLCSCLTPDGAAVVLAGGLCLPLCAVHPEADR